MYRDMTAEDLTEWEALYSIDPWGEERADLRIGILASLTDACHRTKGQPKPPSHYTPLVKQEEGIKPRQSLAEMKAVVAGIKASQERRKRGISR